MWDKVKKLGKHREKSISGEVYMTHEAKESMYSSIGIYIIQICILAVSIIGLLESMIKTFHLPVRNGLLIGTIIVSIIAFFLQFVFFKWLKVTLAVSSAIYLFVMLDWMQELKEGCLNVLNIYIGYYNEYLNTNIMKFNTEYLGEAKSVTAFLIIVMIPLVCAASFVVVRGKGHFLYIALTIPFFISTLSVGLVPDSFYSALYGIGCIGILSAGRVKRQKNRSVNSAAMKTAAVLMLAFCTVILITSKVFTKEIYEDKIDLKNYKMNLQQGIQEFDIKNLASGILPNKTAVGGIGGGRLGRVSNVQFSNSTMLEVTLPDQMNRMYLRSFIGSNYKVNRWNKDFGDQLQNRLFHPLNSTTQFLDIVKENEKIPFSFSSADVKVKKVNKDDNYSNVPYNTSSFFSDDIMEENKSNPKEYSIYYLDEPNEIPGIFDNEGFNLIMEYYIRMKINQNLMESMVGKPVEQFDKEDEEAYAGMQMEELCMDSNSTELNNYLHFSDYYPVSDIFSKRLALSAFSKTNLVNDELNSMKKFLEFKKNEAEYRKVVYNQYLSLPQNSCKDLINIWKNQYFYRSEIDSLNNLNNVPSFVADIDPSRSVVQYYKYSFDGYEIIKENESFLEQVSVLTIINYVKNYLAKNTEYSLNPGTTPKGKDFVEYFLEENKKGYCAHYASAATIMFRAMGIPARYVEGYVVTQKDINNGKIAGDSKINNYGKNKYYWDRDPGSMIQTDIKDTNAHSWTEIYIDGYGWIPIEVTPGYVENGVTSLPKEITEPKMVLNTQEGINTAPAKAKNNEKKEEADPDSKNTVSEEAKKQEKNPQSIVDDEYWTKRGVHLEWQKNLLIESQEKMNETIKKAISVISKFTNPAVAFVFIILVLFFRYKIILRRKRKLLNTKNRVLRAELYYIEINKLLGFYKLVPLDTPNYTDHCRTAEKENLYMLTDGIYMNCIKVMVKSKFSKEKITEDEMMLVKKCYDEMIYGINHRANKRQRYYLRYIKGLDIAK